MKKYVIANWKMNGNEELCFDFCKSFQDYQSPSCHTVVCPPTVFLNLFKHHKPAHLLLGAQDCHAQEKGAYTGDISALMLKEQECHFVILGHSERRPIESDEDIAKKVFRAQQTGLMTVLCVGETLQHYQEGQTLEFIEKQLKASLPPFVDPSRLIIAYEPIWAIGTGLIPTPEVIAHTHAHIRSTLKSLNCDDVSILYGGSVNKDNAVMLASIAGVDGFLVGGASLDANHFQAIINAI